MSTGMFHFHAVVFTIVLCLFDISFYPIHRDKKQTKTKNKSEKLMKSSYSTIIKWYTSASYRQYILLQVVILISLISLISLCSFSY